MRKLSWWKALILFLAGLIALYLGNEWRVERQWQRYAADAKSRGVKLLLTDFAQPPIPDEENFAALPLWQNVFAQGITADPFKLPNEPNAKKGNPGLGNPIKGETIDWAAWQSYFQKVGYLKETTSEPARDVLTALEHYAPQFDEWNQGQSRPGCRFPLDLSLGAAMPLTHLGVFQSITRLLVLRLRAHLALGDTTAALADFHVALQGYQRLTNDPTMISGLVRISLLHMIVAAVGDGLKDRVWHDAELREIQTEFGKVRLAADYSLAMKSEHGFLNTIMNSVVEMPALERGRYVAQWPWVGPTNPSLSGPYAISWQESLFALIPRSAFRENQLRANHYIEELLAQVDAITGRFDPNRPTPSGFSENTSDLERLQYFVFAQSAWTYAMIQRRYLMLQTRLDQARLVCALERYRLAKGAYPDTLATLVPEFIETEPKDPYANAPYHYQTLNGKTFRLYGVGPNHQDDGGIPDPAKSDTNQLDDIWPHAPAEAPSQ